MIHERNNNQSILKVKIEKAKTNEKTKTIILILMIAILFGLILIVKNSISIIDTHKFYEQYQAQLEVLKNEEEYKKAEEEKKQAEQEKKEKEKEEREKQQKLPKLTEKGRNNIENIYHSEIKRAFLTFDDGPSSVTPTILDILKQENIKATFFVLGSRVEAMPETVKRIYDEGHFIANHGYSHTYSSIYSSPQAVLDEFNKCNDLVKNAINQPEYNSHLFRFPGGLAGGKYEIIKKEAKELLLETTKPTVEYEMQRIQETVSNKSSVVILMHDAEAKKVTAEALPQIISWLKECGYEFKNFYEIIK